MSAGAQATPVTRAERERLMGHHALCVWLTGLSGAGKTTLAHATERLLHAAGMRTARVDGDELRTSLCRDLGFSAADRAENVRRAAAVARALFESGAVVFVALISPFAVARAEARRMFPDGAFMEVHVSCPLDVCQLRDPKGLYAKAARGEILDMTGVGSPYEAPTLPELVIDTSGVPIDASTAALERAIRARIIG